MGKNHRNLAGHRIQAARALHRPALTQDDLCAKLQVKYQIDISKNGISRIEHVDRYITDIELVAISEILGVPDLFGKWLYKTLFLLFRMGESNPYNTAVDTAANQLESSCKRMD